MSLNNMYNALNTLNFYPWHPCFHSGKKFNWFHLKKSIYSWLTVACGLSVEKRDMFANHLQFNLTCKVKSLLMYLFSRANMPYFYINYSQYILHFIHKTVYLMQYMLCCYCLQSLHLKKIFSLFSFSIDLDNSILSNDDQMMWDSIKTGHICRYGG